MSTDQNCMQLRNIYVQYLQVPDKKVTIIGKYHGLWSIIVVLPLLFFIMLVNRIGRFYMGL